MGGERTGSIDAVGRRDEEVKALSASGGWGFRGECGNPETRGKLGLKAGWSVGQSRQIRPRGGCRGWRGAGGTGGTGLAQLFFQGAWGWEPDCGGFMECGRWEEEAVDVGHLFWKFGSNEGRKEVAQVAGSRETLLLFF